MRTPRFRTPLVAVALGAAAALAIACDDPFAEFLGDVPSVPLEATLFDFSTSRLQDPAAYDIIREQAVRVDQSSAWDFLFQIRDGASELVPFAAATDSTTDSGLIRSQETFDGVLEAPTEGYTLTTPLAATPGDVFIVRSRIDPSQVVACSVFAKIEILDVDLTERTLTFHIIGNPNCGDTVLEPGTHGDL
ncbi:MAG: hypothetical protein MJB57_08865 [Gemmatimonadetes bacterium]|nr:hypothetical protein [Gemmatimonadota bacterium]